MLRSKDFYLKGVYNNEGKKLGVVEDIFIDFHKGEILGFYISNYSMFSKKNFASIKDLLVFDEEIIVKNIGVYDGLKLSTIKGMDVIDERGSMKGVVEDIIIDCLNYKIKGLIINTGIIERILRGKEILLLSQCVLGEDFIIFHGKEGVSFKTLPHSVGNNGMVKET